ncbi:MAG: hypothetical protein GX256_09090 [Fretibacterium sp.]|nr:hypothetical protein [Fretibacterium sp.]
MSKKKLLGTAAVLLFLLSGAARADYQFDDVYGPSGANAQWMIVTGGGSETVGDPTVNLKESPMEPLPLDVQGDIVDGRSPVTIHNGNSNTPLELSEREIHTMFLVLPGTYGRMYVNFARTPMTPTTPPTTPDVNVDSSVYKVEKVPLPSNPGDIGKLYLLHLNKTADSSFGTTRGNFSFHQNPSGKPSQTLNVPLVIANVYFGTARYYPLLFRATLRDQAGNITAYDRFTWNTKDHKTTGESQWVFVPMSSWEPSPSPSRVNYPLTTEVVNYTGIRYQVGRYDTLDAPLPLIPIHWAFDLPPMLGVPKNFQLAEMSHIAPGLVTVYRHSFNMLEGGKIPLYLSPVDPAKETYEGEEKGMSDEASLLRNLTLSHRIIKGVDLGTVFSKALFQNYRVTAFRLIPASGRTFLENVARAMHAQSVGMPTAPILSSGTVGFHQVSAESPNSFAVDVPIPGGLPFGGEGLLPLHITFNLPRTDLLLAPRWNELLKKWHETGNIHSEFARHFSVYLRSGSQNDLDLIRELQDLGVYNSAMKVFLDERYERITVSFIAMMMDGTRNGAQPAIRIVKDKTENTNDDYIVLRDGQSDNKWRMTFYTAPARGVPDSGQTPPVVIVQPTKPDGGGGGCNAGPGAGVLGVLLLLRKNRKKTNAR